MCDSVVILRLYSHVLHEHRNKYKVSEADIRAAIQNMNEVYKPNPGSLSDSFVYVADYNDAAHRCAYLHKYAPFHTAMVADMLLTALKQNQKMFKDLIYPSGRINICSLGGGPGSDVFGVLSVLNATFGNFQVSATVIDCMENWKDLFYDLIMELRYGNYGALKDAVNEQYFEWKYLQHNLLGGMTNQVNQAIGRANLVTMIKFVSASSCKDTSAMIKKIFRTVKPGSLVLYIDNAGGGFHQVVRKGAEDCNLITVFGPLKHELYKNLNFNTKRYGYTPCLETKVSVQIWRKPSQNLNTHLKNELSVAQAEVNVLPTICNANQNKEIQPRHFESKRQGQKSNLSNSREIYRFVSPESIANQRLVHNFPVASSHSTYEYCQRIMYSQTYSYLAGTPESATNHTFDARRIACNESARHLPKHAGTPESATNHNFDARRIACNESARHLLKHSAIHSQSRSTASSSLQPKRNREPKHAAILSQPQNITTASLPPERNRDNEDCCGCCVIS